MKSSKYDLILCIWTYSNICHHTPHMLGCIMKFTYQKYQVSQISLCCLLMIQQCGLQQYWYSEGHLWTNNNRYATCFIHSTKIICQRTGPLPTNILQLWGETSWTVKTNEELDKLIKHKNIINHIKAQRLSWFGHVQRMPDTRTVKKIFNPYPANVEYRVSS
jgi:hypothetical protein